MAEIIDGKISYIKSNDNVDNTIAKISRNPSRIINACKIFGVVIAVGIVFSIIGFIIYSKTEYPNALLVFGSYSIILALGIFVIIFSGVLIHNYKIKRYIKNNVRELSYELSGNYYYVNNFDLYFTNNYIISNAFNKNVVVKYSDIKKVYAEPIGTTYAKSYNNYGLVDTQKLAIYGGKNNIVIRTQNGRKFIIPSPDVDNKIRNIIYYKNPNVEFDVSIESIGQSRFFNENFISKVADNMNAPIVSNEKIQSKVNAEINASIVCGIISVFIFWYLAVVGLLSGIFALRMIKEKNLKGKKKAIIGIIVCVVSIVLYAVTKIFSIFYN